MYSIVLHKNAVKFFKKADSNLQARISTAIDDISKKPIYNVHVKKLRGELQHLLRYRVGDVRILFEIDEESKTIRIVLIESRGGAYN